MEDNAETLREVAHDYVSWNSSVMAALAALLDDIEIAAGLEDIFSINAFVDIARTLLGNAESACGVRALLGCFNRRMLCNLLAR